MKNGGTTKQMPNGYGHQRDYRDVTILTIWVFLAYRVVIKGDAASTGTKKPALGWFVCWCPSRTRTGTPYGGGF
jgi:hypothetical protein